MYARTDLRPAAVAGSFYPADTDQLRREMARCLSSHPVVSTPPGALKALIVPHAGTVYSGATAGHAYAQLAPLRGKISRVVLLGPCHRVALRGLAVPSVAGFATPLGTVALDRQAIAALAALPQVVQSDAAHAQEHALEVQLPFLQTVLDEFSLVPLAVGDASDAEVAQVLETLWGGDDTLIVISSDLSHFHPYRAAQHIDDASVAQILALAPLASHEQACGATPINGLLEVARRRGLHIVKLAQCNSGDTAGERSRVVGYAAFALYQPQAKADELGPTVLGLARAAIAGHLGAAAETSSPALPELSGLPILAAPGASFVTLTLHGHLRGCIGSLEARRPLREDIAANAIAATCRDWRFAPLGAKMFSHMRIEVSLLSAHLPLAFEDEAGALAQLRPHVDGVIFDCGWRRSTFLPQVWSELPDPRDFLAELKQKAGLPRDWWSPEARLYRYEVQKWKES
ncbi:MAG: AmmeMemoRadiSam system protein B [Burkholderiales bacterium]|nr:AmmeMemoRadiSam system protein B [Burkholderiales bacterium]